MARLRYVKTLEQVKQAAETDPEFLQSTVRSIRCVYETDPAVARALIPRPLEAAERPEIQLTLSQVTIHVAPELDIEIGSAIFGAAAIYDGVPGTWLVTMPMTSEAAVVGGRETYGEPKKIADIDFRLEDGRGSATVTRMGVPYIEVRGALGEELGARFFVEHAYCIKALPSCEKGKDFDVDPLLVRLEWSQEHRRVARMEGELILRDSAFDPVADVPVRRLLRMEYEEGSTRSSGRVLRSLPGSWLLPVLHQRYDDPTARGIEIA
jgi:acetoacetate decarboxylase